MAKIIESDALPQTISSSYSWWQNASLGIFLGVIYWGLVLLIGNYVSSKDISSNIATIITATMGIVFMLRLQMAQPLIINVASALSLWGLLSWLSGLNAIETVGWMLLLYGLCYVLFSWLARIVRVTPLIIMVIIAVIAIRVAVVL